LQDLLQIEALAAYRDDSKAWFTSRDAIKRIIAERIATETVDHWLSILEPADIWCSKVLEWPELLASDGFRILDMLQTVTREDDVSIGTTRCPVRVDGRRADRRAGGAARRRTQRPYSRGVRLMGITLKGMTWSHPRGYDPMVACSEDWLQKTGVSIEWDKRRCRISRAFPSRNLRAITISSSSTTRMWGRSRRKTALRHWMDRFGRPLSRRWPRAPSANPSRATIGRVANGPSRSMRRPRCSPSGRIGSTRRRRYGRTSSTSRKPGEVLLPLRPPHSLMCLFTLCGNLGHPCSVDRDRPFVDAETGVQAIEMIRELAALVEPACIGMDPIAVLDLMGEEGARYSLSPLIYGYVSYSLDGFRANRIAFADMPISGTDGLAGSALGGTGIAVSAFSENREAAIDFAYWIAGGAVQSDRYWRSGGQPGHAAGWEDEAANAATLGFYRNTRSTLEGAWLRPRHDGYMPFQEAASQRINRAVTSAEPAAKAVADLNDLFVKSFR
jgi:multiple sugar transport system substrate-binding protein